MWNNKNSLSDGAKVMIFKRFIIGGYQILSLTFQRNMTHGNYC